MKTFGGISVLNAIPSGIGAVIPINLSFQSRIVEGGEDTDEMDLRILKEVFHLKDKTIGIIKSSNIPSGVGLKSSSAYTSSIIGSYSKFCGKKISGIEIARKSSIASRKVGMSITGAFDDALASVSSKFVITDNRKNEVLAMRGIPRMKVIIAIPDLIRPPNVAERLRNADFRSAIYNVLKGNFNKGAIINGYSVAKALGYPTEPLDELAELGSHIFGYSGNGPALFAAVNHSNISGIRNYLKNIGMIIETETRGE